MKARVKATGEIVELNPYDEVYEKQKEPFKSKMHKICHLEGIEIFHDPDYWTRLEHQYAGMAMQSYVSNNVYLREIREMCKEPQEMRDLIADLSILLATTLIQKLKKKEERK